MLIFCKRRHLTSVYCPLFVLFAWRLMRLNSNRFLQCPFFSFCWNRIFSIFNIAWVSYGSLCSSVLQLLEGPPLPKKPRLIWLNLSKALLSELWFERNQQIFHDKEKPNPEILLSAEQTQQLGVPWTKILGLTPFKIFASIGQFSSPNQPFNLCFWQAFFGVYFLFSFWISQQLFCLAQPSWHWCCFCIASNFCIFSVSALCI